MKLIPDAGRVLRHAWSIKLILAAAMLSGLEVALAIAGPLLPIRPGVLAGISMLVTVGAFISRFVVQTSISGDKK